MQFERYLETFRAVCCSLSGDFSALSERTSFFVRAVIGYGQQRQIGAPREQQFEPRTIPAKVERFGFYQSLSKSAATNVRTHKTHAG